MSITTSAPVQAQTVSGASYDPSIRDNIVADAKNLPDLVTKAEAADPELAARLLGTPTLASKTAPGVFIAYALTWAATRYGLGWSPDFCAMLAGVIVAGAGYAFHYFRHATSLMDTTVKATSTGAA